MATVTKQFKQNYEFWIAKKIESGEFSPAEADDLKVMIRKDLTEGPDQLRGITNVIDDHDERYRLWDAFFAAECNEIRSAAGVNERIRFELAEQKSKAA